MPAAAPLLLPAAAPAPRRERHRAGEEIGKLVARGEPREQVGADWSRRGDASFI